MRSVQSHSTSGREKGGKKDWTRVGLKFVNSAVHGAMGCSQKSYMLIRRFHQHLSLKFVNHAVHGALGPRLWANDKGDHGMIPVTMHRYSGIYLMAEEKPRKTSARRPSDQSCATSHHLRWDPSSPNEVDRIAQDVRKGEGRKDRKDGKQLFAIGSLKFGLIIGIFYALF